MNLERIFNEYHAVLDKHKKQLAVLQFSLDDINAAKKTLCKNKSAYSYSFSTISMIIPKSMLPNHTIPRTLKNVKIVLSTKEEIVIKSLSKKRVEDPFSSLGTFNINLYSQDSNHFASWHLDRHVQKQGENSPSSLHPLYHLTFGGHHMEEEQNNNDDYDEFGRSLILRAPRVMHPPMELILGIDFIFNHFVPKDKLDLLSDPGYLRIIKYLKFYFWMPFSLAIAKNYCERIAVDNEPLTFDDSFVSSVLSL
ncbi:hypothetical protein QNH98_02250 [Myroides sp. mNGS23_01]|nr:hypothetical protein [Myroides sp. mNGS23_01]WHT39544.1 hypothetical protein QNH98_02250 [Myroides sp. mNGS23_01]